MKQLTIRKIKEEVKMHLDQNRYEHTLGVMYTAGALAMRYGADLEDTMIAGLLHDCAKCIPSAQKIELCKKYNLNISEAEQKNPGLLHAKLGAYLAKEIYQIENTEILDAISCHTTGRPHMTLLDKIIYIADYIEPMRYKASRLPEIRKIAFQDLDECMYEILKDTLEYLEEDSAEDIEPTSREAYIYYKELHNKRSNVTNS